jgi:Prenyltransferase and squalene oxidase repeat
MSIEIVVCKQNADGGWPYVRGTSWTEPTVYAVLASLAAGEMEPAKRGLNWLLARQLADGGWPPQAGVDESTWVTSLVALLPPEHLGSGVHARAIAWLMAAKGQESGATYRFREWLLGHARSPEQEFAGWPWIPGAAAWVGPTSLAILALDKEQRRRPTAAIRARLEEGRRFLLNRMCHEGGWNHGSVRALGYESSPYPETTGMALAALRGVRNPQLDRAVPVAQSFLAVCRSADALNWLRLGLLAHGQLQPGFRPSTPVAYRTLPDTSLNLLVAEAQKGNPVFLGV